MNPVIVMMINVPRLRKKDWARLGILTGTVVVVVIIELTSSSVRVFYAEHPLQAGVLTGILLSVVAFFGFDAVRADLNERRWQPLSRLALLSLAYQTTLVIDVMLWLVTARRPVNDAAPRNSVHEELEGIRRDAGLQPPPDKDLGAVHFTDYNSTMQVLIRQPVWLRFAIHQLDQCKWRNRAGIATWASAMLTTGESADVLNRLAQLNEDLSDVQDFLRKCLGPNPPSAAFDTAATCWLSCHAEAVSLREDLVRVGRKLPPAWAAFRLALRPDDQEQLSKRDNRANHTPADPLAMARHLLTERLPNRSTASTTVQRQPPPNSRPL